MAMDPVIYVKGAKEAKLVGRTQVLVQDLAKLEGDPDVVKELLSLEVLKLAGGRAQKTYAGFLDIARAIRQVYPKVILECVGEPDTVISYVPYRKNGSRYAEWAKVILICFVLFWGSMLTLMTFHNEASIPEVFVNVHRLLTGEETERPILLIVSYAVGIALGIGCFFNHFGKKKLTDDPTPVQVEFVSYKKQIEDAIVDQLEDKE